MYTQMSAGEIVRKISTKEASAVAVATEFIKKIQEVNDKINAIHQFDPERILKDARKKDEEIAAGKKLGKLHGLPVSILPCTVND